MGKWNQNEQAASATEGAVAVAEASKGRKIMLKNPSTGEEVARVDLIKNLFEGGMKRSEIRKHLKEVYNHDIPYQIVFAATKAPKGKPEGEAATDAGAAA